MKWFFFSIGLLFLAIVLIASTNSKAIAQHWTQVFMQPKYDPQRGYPGDYFSSPYFIDQEHGFIFTRSNCGSCLLYRSHLYRTKNGGVNWDTLSLCDSLKIQVSQIYFVSSTHGYLSATDTTIAGNGGIYETFDLGDHWKKISKGYSSFSSVYATKNIIFATPYQPIVHIRNANGIFSLSNQPPSGHLFFSIDDGDTWDSVVNFRGMPSLTNMTVDWITGNRDSLIIATGYDTANLGMYYTIYSNDLGHSWNCEPLVPLNDWPNNANDAATNSISPYLFCFPHGCEVLYYKFFYEKISDTSIVMRSSSDFTQWDTTKVPALAELFQGNQCALYIRQDSGTEDFEVAGSLRSTDFGNSWKYIPGWNLLPHQYDDNSNFQHYAVVGYGASVFATDRTGELWKTTDGGDGTLSAAALAPQIEYQHGNFAGGNDTLFISHCSSSSAVVYYQNLRCAITKMDSISLFGLPSNQYSLTSTHHNDCLSLPDSTYIAFSSIPPGIYPITIQSHFTDDEYNTIDTTLNFVLDVQASGTSVPLTISFQSSSMNAAPGDTISVPVYLSGAASLGATSLTLPFGVDTNILVPVGFQPAISGLTVGSLSHSGGTETVPLQFQNLLLNGQTLLGYLRCIVYLTDTLSTAITLPSATLNSATTPCTALSLATDSIAITIVGCGTKTLQQAMLGKPITFGIERIVPNPAMNEITIRVVGGDSAAHTFTISDPLGRVLLRQSPSPNPLPEGEGFVIDVSSLPAGVYYVSDGISAAKFVKE